MKVFTSKQMKALEHKVITGLGISALMLMENAAIGICEEIRNIFSCDKKVMVVCGTGNNGGDGLALSRHLSNHGFLVYVVIFGDSKTEENQKNLEIVRKMGITIYDVQDETQFYTACARLEFCDLVVDAIFGTGLKNAISDVYEKMIAYINGNAKYVVSIDIPSGINPDTGAVANAFIKANRTIALGYAKLGHYIYPACEYMGELVVSDIAIPDSLADNNTAFLITDALAKSLIPKRAKNSHKGDFGKVFIVGGSVGMTGAPTLAALAALRVGAGLVTVGCPASTNSILEEKLTEAMTLPLLDEGGALSITCLGQITKKASESDVLVIGCGLSDRNNMENIIFGLIKTNAKPMIIDADGLNALSKNVEILRQKTCEIVLTPHLKEMSRLTGKTIEEINGNRVETIREFATTYQVTLVLKGANTLVCDPDGKLYINITGNNGMATGGSGDVLAGIIGGLCGQGLSPANACALAVYLHGNAGDLARDRLGEHSMLPSDMISELPNAIRNIIQGLNGN